MKAAELTSRIFADQAVLQIRTGSDPLAWLNFRFDDLQACKAASPAQYSRIEFEFSRKFFGDGVEHNGRPPA